MLSTRLIARQSRRLVAQRRLISTPVEEVTSETRLKNLALAVLLLTFCGSVTFYSMTAVGQAGSLEEEAAAAQTKQARQEKSQEESNQLLEQFQRGELDPDRVEEEDELEEEAPKKRPWWKIW